MLKEMEIRSTFVETVDLANDASVTTCQGEKMRVESKMRKRMWVVESNERKVHDCVRLSEDSEQNPLYPNFGNPR